HSDQSAHAFAIEFLEWIGFQNTLCQVVGDDLACIIPRKAEGGLRQVIRSEGEKLCRLGNLIGNHSRARQLDHRAGEILDLYTGLSKYFLGDAVDDRLLLLQLLRQSDKGDHDLRLHDLSLQLNRDRKSTRLNSS